MLKEAVSRASRFVAHKLRVAGDSRRMESERIGLLARLRVEAAARARNVDPIAVTEDMLQESAASFAVPVSWVAATAQHPDVNLGDALSPVIVAAMSGLPVRHAHFDESIERIVSVGTIGQSQRLGTVHFWGTGVDATRNAVQSPFRHYIRPPQTRFQVHGLRGVFSARVLRENGIDVPEIYGDPVWFLPRLFPEQRTADIADLGVVLHITELDRPDSSGTASEEFKRYLIPPSLAGRVRLINTYVRPTLEAIGAKIREMTSCRCLLSTSLHGMVIAEAYGIPCAWFAPFAGGLLELPVCGAGLADIDHRLKDFYSGAGRDRVLTYAQKRDSSTDWEAAIAAIERAWKPLRFDDRPLFDSFPLPQAVGYSQGVWPLGAALTLDGRL